jgi:dipeptidyl-peptidase 4
VTVPGDSLAISPETLEDDELTGRVFGNNMARDVATVRSLSQPAVAPRVTLLKAGDRELRTAVTLPRDEVRPSGPLPVIMDSCGCPT